MFSNLDKWSLFSWEKWEMAAIICNELRNGFCNEYGEIVFQNLSTLFSQSDVIIVP